MNSCGFFCDRGMELDEDNCECLELCRMNCPYGSNLDRDLCECVQWLTVVEDCGVECPSYQELDETTCECFCPRVSVCKADNRYWDDDTCACEETECIMDCPRRFSLDVTECACFCDLSCDNPKKPVLDTDLCKCLKE
jgi:hypothetical protein